MSFDIVDLDLRQEYLTFEQMSTKKKNPEGKLFVLNPYIDAEDDCEGDAFPSSIHSVTVGDEPRAFIVYGFGGEDVVECASTREMVVKGYVQHTAKCEDDQALELVRCGANALQMTPDNPQVVSPYPNMTYTFINYSAKRLYIVETKLFENKWIVPELPCCCVPPDCGCESDGEDPMPMDDGTTLI